MNIPAWRLKKLEKREKQRAANIGRAEQMQAYWLENDTLATFKKNKTPKINIGCSGWFYWHWRGKFYPEVSQPKDWFKIYGKNFHTVELNAPFYSWPTIATVKSWLRQVPNKEFVYTVKVSELITHVKQFKATKKWVDNFTKIATILDKQMGCFLFQLPPSFKFTKKRLQMIVNQLNPCYRNVVEFRHASWWNEEVYEAFRAHKIIFCSTSSPKLPAELIKTHDEIYIRFHGSSRWYRHNYTLAELKEWAEKIKKAKAKRVWVYFNNDPEAYAVKNAKTLRKLLK